MERELKATIYFADPHAPWQRGTNENGLLRFFYPKGTDFAKVDVLEFKNCIKKINERPRKILGWKTPKEVYFNACFG
jgi:IS30 family transposase